MKADEKKIRIEDASWAKLEDDGAISWGVRFTDLAIPSSGKKIHDKYSGAVAWVVSKSGKKSKVILGECVSVRNCTMVFRVDQAATDADRAAYFASRAAK